MTTVISVLISLIFTIGVAVFLIGRIDRRTRPHKIMEELRTEIGGVIVELNATTDRNVQIIEDRIAELKKLIATADRKIKLLHEEKAKADRGDQLYVQLRKAKSAYVEHGADGKPVVSQPENADPATRPPITLAEAAPAQSAEKPQDDSSAQTKAIPLTAESTAAESTAAESTPADPEAAESSPQQRIRSKVWEMYAMGERVEKIAARVGRTEGEIELMISLLPKEDT